jgi:hypothetical protein
MIYMYSDLPKAPRPLVVIYTIFESRAHHCETGVGPPTNAALIHRSRTALPLSIQRARAALAIEAHGAAEPIADATRVQRTRATLALAVQYISNCTAYTYTKAILSGAAYGSAYVCRTVDGFVCVTLECQAI